MTQEILTKNSDGTILEKSDVMIRNKDAVLTTSVFLRCTNAIHVDCIGLLRTVRGLANVTYAETTDVMIDNEKYCVHGIALVKSDEIDRFKTQLKSLDDVEKTHVFVGN